MVLENYIVLEPDKPVRFHFYDHAIVEKRITDPDTGASKVVRSLEMQADRVGGREITAKLSILSEKLARMLQPYFEGKAYKQYDFVITKVGHGYISDFKVEVVV